MKKILFITILMCLISIHQIFSQELTISTHKRKYCLEPVLVQATIKNQSDKHLIMPLVFETQDVNIGFKFLSTPSGKIQSKYVELKWIESELDVLNMSPYSFYSVEINLSKWFDLTTKGTYKLQVRYESGKHKSAYPKNTWSGKLKSNIISFDISCVLK